MNTFFGYAVFPDFSVFIAHGNNSHHLMDFVQRVCDQNNIKPWGISVMPDTGNILGKVYTIEEYKKGGHMAP